MYNRDKFDWETREDAETIKRFKEIESNPDRLNKAKSCIRDSVETGKKALGIKATPPTRNSNPATIQKINPKF